MERGLASPNGSSTDELSVLAEVEGTSSVENVAAKNEEEVYELSDGDGEGGNALEPMLRHSATELGSPEISSTYDADWAFLEQP